MSSAPGELKKSSANVSLRAGRSGPAPFRKLTQKKLGGSMATAINSIERMFPRARDPGQRRKSGRIRAASGAQLPRSSRPLRRSRRPTGAALMTGYSPRGISLWASSLVSSRASSSELVLTRRPRLKAENSSSPSRRIFWSTCTTGLA